MFGTRVFRSPSPRPSQITNPVCQEQAGFCGARTHLCTSRICSNSPPVGVPLHPKKKTFSSPGVRPRIGYCSSNQTTSCLLIGTWSIFKLRISYVSQYQELILILTSSSRHFLPFQGRPGFLGIRYTGAF